MNKYEMKNLSEAMKDELERLGPLPKSRLRLYDYPKPLPGESFSSWAARASAQYAMPVKKFILLCFGIEIYLDVIVDPDMRLPADLEALLASMTGEDPSVFKGVFRIAEHNLLEPSISDLHRQWHYARSRSRFCATCLRNDSIPYFRALWRDMNQTHCDVHDSPLANACPHCNLPVSAIRHADAQRTTRDLLGYCPYCRKQLGVVKGEEESAKNAPRSRQGLANDFPDSVNRSVDPDKENLQRCIPIANPSILEAAAAKFARMLQNDLAHRADHRCFAKDDAIEKDSERSLEHSESLWIGELESLWIEALELRTKSYIAG